MSTQETSDIVRLQTNIPVVGQVQYVDMVGTSYGDKVRLKGTWEGFGPGKVFLNPDLVNDLLAQGLAEDTGQVDRNNRSQYRWVDQGVWVEVCKHEDGNRKYTTIQVCEPQEPPRAQPRPAAPRPAPSPRPAPPARPAQTPKPPAPTPNGNGPRPGPLPVTFAVFAATWKKAAEVVGVVFGPAAADTGPQATAYAAALNGYMVGVEKAGAWIRPAETPPPVTPAPRPVAPARPAPAPMVGPGAPGESFEDFPAALEPEDDDGLPF